MKISGYSSMFILHKKKEKSMGEARHLSFTNGFESNMLHFTRKGGILSETNNVKNGRRSAGYSVLMQTYHSPLPYPFSFTMKNE